MHSTPSNATVRINILIDKIGSFLFACHGFFKHINLQFGFQNRFALLISILTLPWLGKVILYLLIQQNAIAFIASAVKVGGSASSLPRLSLAK